MTLEEIMNFWVAGADWDGEDQTAEFIEKGIWQNGYTDKYLDRVNAIQAGDRIAIKAIYGQNIICRLIITVAL